jgi:hypothetical protein
MLLSTATGLLMFVLMLMFVFKQICVGVLPAGATSCTWL